jgi:hypothetical protein
MNGHNSSGSELLWVDFCSCAYEVSNSDAAGGLYEFHRYHNRQYQIESPLSEPLHKKLEYIFPQCIVYYMPFVQDPEGFLHDVPHALLWDERTDGYAVVIKHSGGEPGERMLAWLCLKPNGYVFASLLSIPETTEESKNWQIIRAPSSGFASRAAEEMFFKQNLNFYTVLEAFPSFLTKLKGVYNYLYANSLGIYQDIIASPEQMRENETGSKEIAIGFLSNLNGYTLIMAKETTGNGWTKFLLTNHAGAARLQAKLSRLNQNIGGIKWKQIDIPYGIRVHIDDGVVFYNVKKLHKPEKDKTSYMFEFRLNRSKAYIRFPYVFRSYKKIIDFIKRAKALGSNLWIRAGRN